MIRHSMTEGNKHKRYIGVTDEPLCPEGVELAKQKQYPAAERLYVSPLLRCVQTAQILFPGQEYVQVPEFAECDFGIFENKNAEELSDCAEYQQWMNSMGKAAFPGGESKEHFLQRCITGMDFLVQDCREKGASTAAMVVHGGTIMNLLEHFAQPKREFYDWYVENAGGYVMELDVEAWRKEERAITQVIKI
jgi:alpha-ribazole phosphatase